MCFWLKPPVAATACEGRNIAALSHSHGAFSHGGLGRRVSTHALQVTRFSVARVTVLALVRPSFLVPSEFHILETLSSDPAISVFQGREGGPSE